MIEVPAPLGNGNHPGLRGIVEVDEKIAVDIEHLAMLIPAAYTGVAGRVGTPLLIDGEHPCR